MKTQKNISTILATAGIILAAPIAWAQTQTMQSTQQHQNHQNHAAQNSSTPAQPNAQPDAWVLTKVKAQFAASSTVDATDINVDVRNGKVFLAGTVDSERERKEAQRLAQTTEGVTAVDTSKLKIQQDATEREETNKQK